MFLHYLFYPKKVLKENWEVYLEKVYIF
jgi:hypothetical protein